MKKLLLLFSMALLLTGTVQAADTFTVDFSTLASTFSGLVGDKGSKETKSVTANIGTPSQSWTVERDIKSIGSSNSFTVQKSTSYLQMGSTSAYANTISFSTSAYAEYIINKIEINLYATAKATNYTVAMKVGDNIVSDISQTGAFNTSSQATGNQVTFSAVPNLSGTLLIEVKNNNCAAGVGIGIITITYSEAGGPILQEAPLSFSENSATITIGQESSFTAPTLTNGTGATATYSSSVPSVATVSQTGVITPLSAGTTVISADTPETSEYLEGHAEYTLLVIDPNADYYELVTNISQIGESAQCIIVNTEKAVAMSTTQNANFRGITSVIIQDGKIQPGIDVALITLESNGSQYSLKTTNGASATGNTNALGYLCPVAGQNYIRTNATTPSYATIAIDESSNATITYTISDDESRFIQFNSDRFACYKTAQTPVQLYINTKSVSDVKPAGLSFSEESCEVTLDEENLADILPTLDNPNSVSPIVWSSSDQQVATVNTSTGDIELVGAGTTTISAAFAGDDTYSAQTVSYQLTVIEQIPGTMTEIDWTTNSPGSVDGTNGTNIGTITHKTAEGVEITIETQQGEKGTMAPRWWVYDGTPEARFYANNTITFSMLPGYYLTGVEFIGRSGLNNLTSADPGTVVSDNRNAIWTYPAVLPEPSDVRRKAEGQNTSTVTFTFSGRADVTGTNVYFVEDTSITGVETIGTPEGKAVYFNLQGVKVANPDKGIYIKVENGKAKKIVL